MKNLFIISLVLFLTTLSALGFLWGLKINSSEKNSKNWPSTIGTVVESRVIGPTGRLHPTYSTQWKYEFYVKSVKYSSTRNAFGVFKGFRQKNNAELELNRHPVGSKVKVIYDPENPSYAALQLSSSGSLYWMLIFVGGLCTLTGVMILTVLFKYPKVEGIRL